MLLLTDGKEKVIKLGEGEILQPAWDDAIHIGDSILVPYPVPYLWKRVWDSSPE